MECDNEMRLMHDLQPDVIVSFSFTKDNFEVRPRKILKRKMFSVFQQNIKVAAIHPNEVYFFGIFNKHNSFINRICVYL